MRKAQKVYLVYCDKRNTEFVRFFSLLLFPLLRTKAKSEKKKLFYRRLCNLTWNEYCPFEMLRSSELKKKPSEKNKSDKRNRNTQKCFEIHKYFKRLDCIFLLLHTHSHVKRKISSCRCNIRFHFRLHCVSPANAFPFSLYISFVHSSAVSVHFHSIPFHFSSQKYRLFNENE